MWTPAARRQHSRAGVRHASDLTDAELRILEPRCCPARPDAGGGVMAAVRDRQRHLLRAAGGPTAPTASHPGAWSIAVRPAARLRRARGDQPSPRDARP